MYICADYPYYSCLFAFSTAILTSLFNFNQQFFYTCHCLAIFYDLRSFRYFTEIIIDEFQ